MDQIIRYNNMIYHVNKKVKAEVIARHISTVVAAHSYSAAVHALDRTATMIDQLISLHGLYFPII